MNLREQIPAAFAWMTQATCRGLPGPEADLAHSDKIEEQNDFAETYCSACPVKAECLKDGANESLGVRGGLNEWQRRYPGRNVAETSFCHRGKHELPIAEFGTRQNGQPLSWCRVCTRAAGVERWRLRQQDPGVQARRRQRDKDRRALARVAKHRANQTSANADPTRKETP